jgi:hypothetical protein
MCSLGYCHAFLLSAAGVDGLQQPIHTSGHILRRNRLLKQIIEGKIKGEIEVIRRRGRRRKKLLDDLKDRRGYCHLKEEALDRTMWGTF